MGGPRLAAEAFVGRSADLSALLHLLTNVRGAGRGQIALIEGEAGIGKTRLLSELIEAVAGWGFTVVRGSARELERDRPFGVLVEALDLRPDSPDSDRAEIGRLLAWSPTEAPTQVPELRFRLVDAIDVLVERLAAGAPLLLCLEDLHWADSSTPIVLDRLARRLHDLRLAIVVTRRPIPSPRELRSFADAIEQNGLRLSLRPLDSDAVRDLVAGMVSAEPGEQLLATVAAAAGNPLFIQELVEALRGEGVVDVSNGRADVRQVLLPPSLRLTILRRLSYLPDDTLEALRLGSVLGSSFSPADLGAVLNLRGLDLLRTLSGALEGGTLADEGSRLVFRHDLVRDAIYEDIPVALRRVLHRDVARALSTAGANATQVATHFGLGANRGEVEAVEWLVRGADEVFPSAPAIAAGFLGRALEIADRDHPDRDSIAAKRIRSLVWSGRLAEAEQLADAFLAGEHDPEAAAGVRYALGRVLVFQGRVADSIALLERALEDERLAGEQRARVFGDLALRRTIVLDLDGADLAADQAQTLGDQLGDDLASSSARSGRAWTTALRGRSTEAVELARAGLTIADRRVREPGQVVQARLYLGRVLLDTDELEEAGRTLEEARQRAEDLGAAWGVPLATAMLALQRYEAGLWDDAVTEAETSLVLAEEVNASIWNITAQAVIALVAIHRDDLAAATAVLRESEPGLTRPGGARDRLDRLRLAHGLHAEARGDRQGALVFLEQAWRENADAGALGDYRELAPELVRLAIAEGHPELAAEVTERVVHAGSESPSSRLVALRCRGLLAGDENLLMEAASLAERQPRPFDGGLAQLDAGMALGQKNRPTDAAVLLRSAAVCFERLGAVALVDRTDAALRDVGVRRGRHGPRSRPKTGWESMTESEQRIVAFVAEGLNNPEIARRLVVSRRTVETHVSHILRKLDLSSRVQLAAEAVRRHIGA